MAHSRWSTLDSSRAAFFVTIGRNSCKVTSVVVTLGFTVQNHQKTPFLGVCWPRVPMTTTYCFDTFFLRVVQNLIKNFTQFPPTLLRLDFQKIAPKCPFSSCFKWNLCAKSVQNCAKNRNFHQFNIWFSGLVVDTTCFLRKMNGFDVKNHQNLHKIYRKMIPTFAKTMAIIKKLIFFIKICQKKLKSFSLSPILKTVAKIINCLFWCFWTFDNSFDHFWHSFDHFLITFWSILITFW